MTDHYLLGSITASVLYGLTKWEESPANNYLLDPEGVLIPDSLGPANNCQFRMILRIILKKKE